VATPEPRLPMTGGYFQAVGKPSMIEVMTAGWFSDAGASGNWVRGQEVTARVHAMRGRR